MFNQILDFIADKNVLSNNGMQLIRDFTFQLTNHTPKLQIELEKLKSKYSIDYSTKKSQDKIAIRDRVYYFNSSKNYHYNNIEFWRDSYEFQLSIGIDGELDNDFLLIVSDSEVQFNYNYDYSDAEINLLSDIAVIIYYTWLGSLWQKNKIYKCGIPTCIEVNSSTETYFFNDFLDSNFSDYYDLDLDTDVEYRAFNRDLTIEEIFICNFFFRLNIKVIELYAEDDTSFKKIVMQDKNISIYEGEFGTKEKLIEEIKFNESHSFDFKQESPKKQLTNKFKIAINSGWDFKLFNCKAEFQK